MLEEILLSVRRIIGSSTMMLQLTLHIRSKNISPPLTTVTGLERAGPVAWPPRSPDLTTMDFFLWGHIKALIYILPVDSEEDLIAHIVEAAATIRQQPGSFERTCQSLLCSWLILR
jgi:hypothetical protein